MYRLSNYYFALGRQVVLLSECLYDCLSICLSAHMSQKPHIQISQTFLYMYFLPVAAARSSFDADTLCISGFVADVIFSHNRANGREFETTRMFRRVRMAAPGRSLPSLTASCSKLHKTWTSVGSEKKTFMNKHKTSNFQEFDNYPRWWQSRGRG